MDIETIYIISIDCFFGQRRELYGPSEQGQTKKLSNRIACSGFMALRNKNPACIVKRGILKRDSSLSSFDNIEPPISDESREKRSVRLNETDNQAVDSKRSYEFPSLDEMVRM
jgi:hypothetical protein